MKQKSKPLVFFGTEQFSATILEQLLKAGFVFDAIITKPDTKRGRGRKLTMPQVKKLGLEYGVTVYQPKNSEELEQAVRKCHNLAGVLVSFGKIIPESIINYFEKGIINVHPSLLPKYRGPSPIESVILNGDSETGVSIMSLIKKMDAGPVYSQINYQLSGNKTASFLYHKLAELGGQELIRILPDILDGKLLAKEQNNEQASYCSMLNKEMSILDPQKTAVELERQVRAFEIYPKSKYNFNGLDCLILQAKVTKNQKTLSIKTANEFLTVERLMTPNGKTMTAEAFKNGYLK